MPPIVLLVLLALAPTGVPVSVEPVRGAPAVADTVEVPEWRQRTVLVSGLRVDPADPPPGSGVGRALAFVGDAYVHVVYGMPFRRGREVFGELVPFGEVWSLGAHYATELVTTAPMLVGTKRLEPGVYSLFATPGEDVWTIYVNTELGMHLTGRYDPANDLFVVSVPVEQPPEPAEAFTIDFERLGDRVDLRITWDRTRVRVPLRPVP